MQAVNFIIFFFNINYSLLTYENEFLFNYLSFSSNPQSFQILSVEIVNSSMYFNFSDYDSLRDVRKKKHTKNRE
jgi:hypothetical protein